MSAPEGGAEGFTLIEMIVVLALIALVAAAAASLPRHASDRAGLESLAREIAAAMRATRTGAIGTNEAAALMLDLDTRQIKSSALPRAITVPAPVTVTFETAAGEVHNDRASIRFYPEGSSTGGRMILRQGGDGVQIAISWLTGAVVVTREERQ